MPAAQPAPSNDPERQRSVTSTGGVLFHAGEIFSAVELQAMQVDGLMQRVVGRSYLRMDYQENAHVRAQSAINCIPRQLRSKVALARQSAAWVYGCAPAPDVVHLVTDHRRRTTALPLFSEAVMHQVTLGPLDVGTVGGVGVTAPLRTALDVAVHGADPLAVEILRRLAAEPGLRCPLPLVAAALLNTRRVPGKTRALQRLQEAMDEN